MKAYRYFIILLGIIIALPFAGRLFWLMKKSKPINIVIINKSVEKSSQNEVKTLNWTLNFGKYVNSDGDIYNFRYDYLGYFPDAASESRKVKSYKLEEISSIAESNDALFFIDNSGIKLKKDDKKSPKGIAYGGFNQNDYFLLKEMISRQKLVVAEYNFFSPPTEDLVRYNTEQFLDIYSLGWTGKFFNNLSKEQVSEDISGNWFDLYKQYYSTDWDFEGPGIILINLQQNRIIVLPAEKYMNSKFPEVVTAQEIASLYYIPQKAAYTGWFEISFEGKNKVISNFDLNLNKEGVNLLRKNGIESEFPAVIESVNKKFYYMAGDFSKVNVYLPISRLGFISRIILNLGKGKTQNPGRFFQVYYNFLLTSILNDYTVEISGPQN